MSGPQPGGRARPWGWRASDPLPPQRPEVGPVPSPQPLPPVTVEPGQVVVPAGYALIPEGYKLVPVPPRPAAPPRKAPQARPGQGRSGAPPAKPPAKRPPAAAPAQRPGPRPAAPLPRSSPESRWYVPSTALLILGALLITFALEAMVLSTVKHSREQTIAFQELRADLANGVTPVEQMPLDPVTATPVLVPLGKPLGIVEVPWLRLKEVYFEGTTSEVLQSGAGHRRDTVMPGQVGTSVLFGRQTAFGGPFGALDLMSVGQQIKVTTGQGVARFRVVAKRTASDEQPPALAAGGARLTLVTATGPPFAPSGVLRVDADLITGVDAQGQPVTAWPSGAKVLAASSLAPSEKVLAGDVAAWPWIVVILVLLLPVAVFILWARHHWGRRQAWVAGLPPLVALGLALSDQALRLLPNLL